jgi:hypothetical protein
MKSTKSGWALNSSDNISSGEMTGFTGAPAIYRFLKSSSGTDAATAPQ